jgi:hypothetical protein
MLSTANFPGRLAKSGCIAESKMDFRPGKRNQFRVRIDIHVQMVGNGVAGSGDWLRLKGWHCALAGFMLRQLGMHPSALEGDLEKIYAEHLLALVRESSLDAVVLLAHERVYDPDGTPRNDLGSIAKTKRFIYRFRPCNARLP